MAAPPARAGGAASASRYRRGATTRGHRAEVIEAEVLEAEVVEPDVDGAGPIPLVLPEWHAAKRPARTPRVLVAAIAVVLVALGVWAVIANRAHSDARPTPQSPGEPSEPTTLHAPAQVRPDSAYTRLTVTGTGDLQVEQWIRSTAAVSGLTVTTPSGPLLAPGNVRATDLQVMADGAVVQGPAEVVDDSATYPFAGARLIRLRYLLSGVLELSSTASGRALARVTSLDLSYEPESSRSVIAFRGARLLSLACVADGDDDPPIACGVQGEDGWTVDVPDPQDYRVMAQLELRRAIS